MSITLEEPMDIALNKVECSTYNGETIYHLFGRDKYRNRQWIRVYNFLPYFYIPENTPVKRHKDVVKVEKCPDLKSIDNRKVKKIYMKNWNSLGVYEEGGYCKRYKKTYEADVNQANRLVIDMGIKSGFRVWDDDIDYGDDRIQPIDYKQEMKRIHLDIEVSTELTRKIPTWENPIEPVYSIANLDSYTKKFTFFIQHPSYKDEIHGTEYKPIIVKSITDKIKEIKDNLKQLDITYEDVKDLNIEISEVDNEELEQIGDYIIYLFKREKYKKTLKSFKSRLKSIKEKFKKAYDVEIRTFSTERLMLENYISYIKIEDPDVLTGWNTQGFDLPYLIARMQVLKCNYREMSPLGYVGINKKHGTPTIKGRTIFDTYRGFKKQQTHELESLKLDVVAISLFAIGKVVHQGIDKMYHEDRRRLTKYNIQDVFLEYAIAEDQGIFSFFYDVKCYAGCDLLEVINNSQIVDTYMLFQSKEKNLVLPSKPTDTDHDKFKGAVVFKPRKLGLVHNVVVLDLASLYPFCMLSLNMGEDTIILNPDPKDIPNLIKSPIDGVFFRKDKPSFLANMIKELLDYRTELKNEVTELYSKGNSAMAELKDRIQVVVKFITNSIYGVLGFSSFRLYNVYIAACIPAVGQMVIRYSGKICNKLGCIVHYGDTDSVFILFPNMSVDEIKIEMMKVADKLNKSYNIFKKIFNIDKHYFKMKAEKIFKNMFMVRKKGTKKEELVVAKKRYTGWKIWHDKLKLHEKCNELAISGFDRSDMSRKGNEIMKEVLLYASCGLISKMKKYVKSEIALIKSGKLPLEEVAFSKGISKPLVDYEEGRCDWVEGAKWTNYHSPFWGKPTNFGSGSKPKYVYLKKSLIPRPYIKVQNNHDYQIVALDEDFELPESLRYKKVDKKVKHVIDYDTLIDKTIRLKIDTILDAVGFNWDSLTMKGSQQSLVNC